MTIMTGDYQMISFGFNHASCNSPNSYFRNKFHTYSRFSIGIF